MLLSNLINHCANTILACRTFEQSTGIKVVRMDFSDPQGGQGAADRLAATCKNHIRTYIDEGNNVTTAAEMKEALLSYGGVEGVRVAILPSMEETVQLQKISGISKLNNFLFTEDSLQAWRAYAIGPGKTIASEKVEGQCHFWEVKNKKGRMSLTGGDSRRPFLLPYVGMVQAIVVVFCKSQHMKQGRRKRNLFFLEYHFLENFVNVTGIRFLLLHRKELINIFLNYSFQ